MTMYLVAAAAVVVCMALAITRALLGPTVYDRVLAVNTFGTSTVLIISLVAFIGGRPDFIDLALVYAMINFISTIAVLKFFEYGDLSRGFITRPEEER
jgi:multicomponent Na+:H+ antiporter subunit F